LRKSKFQVSGFKFRKTHPAKRRRDGALGRSFKFLVLSFDFLGEPEGLLISAQGADKRFAV